MKRNSVYLVFVFGGALLGERVSQIVCAAAASATATIAPLL